MFDEYAELLKRKLDWRSVSPDGLMGALKTLKPFDLQQGLAHAQEAGMQGMMPVGLLGKIVYHGSPHKFDKFDASKIGTGEGAQAYGHGVYLADAPDVAKGYAETLANRDSSGYLLAQKNAKDLVARFKGDPEWAAEVVSDQIRNIEKSDPNFSRLTETLKAIKSGSYAKPLDNSGVLYKADLPDEWIPKMLDWDKPLKEQSKHVLDAFGDTGWFDRSRKAGEYIEFLNQYGAKGLAESLAKKGIPGIRYLDGGSRSAGQGSYNYVVFPGLEDKVKILERNGVPLGLLQP